MQATPDDSKGKAATATWKKRYHRIGYDRFQVPLVRAPYDFTTVARRSHLKLFPVPPAAQMECYRDADNADVSRPVCTFDLRGLVAVIGQADEK